MTIYATPSNLLTFDTSLNWKHMLYKFMHINFQIVKNHPQEHDWTIQVSLSFIGPDPDSTLLIPEKF